MEKKHRQYLSVLIILGVFLLITAAVLGQYGWMINLSAQSELAVLDDEVFQKSAGTEETENGGWDCLYLWDSEDENSQVFYEQMPQILEDMRADYHMEDISLADDVDLQGYESVVIGFANYQDHRELMLNVMDWTEQGGQLLIAQVPETGSVYRWMSPKLGVRNMGGTYYETEGIRLVSDGMLTGDTQEYTVAYPYESTLVVELDDECEIHLVTADSGEVPILWERPAGAGRVVVVNLGHYDKAYRGIYSFAYSLLGEYCAWPVINAAAFYLDGFPLPVTQSENGYITAVYGENTDLYSFYVREWWNDLMELAAEYGIHYCAAMLENNDDEVEPPYEEKGTHNRYQYFLSMVIESGGDMGLYGYNQQPLCLEDHPLVTADGSTGVDYEEDLGLVYWKSREDIAGALEEAVRFQKSILDGADMCVYVPPSNIWSEEGIQVLKDTLPDIKAVAGSYRDSGYAAGQEFEVDEDGMICTPRVTSGSYVSEEARMIAFSELNLHYVNTHAISPNDVVNPDAGADMGWPAMLERLEEMEEWLASAAPDLRQLNGQETAAAVQRFYYLDMNCRETDSGLEVLLSNFHDEAWLMLRLNEWEPDLEAVEGGELTRLQGNLYLLRADQEQITIQRETGL